MIESTSHLQRFQSGLLLFAAALAGFAIPISTAAQNIGGGLLLIAFLLNPRALQFNKQIFFQPFAIAGLLLAAALVLGTLWTSVSQSEAWGFILKMRAYYLIPIFLCLFFGTKVRNALLIGFACGALLSVSAAFVSYLFEYPMRVGVPGDWAVFRTHTYHNYFASLLAVGLLAGLLNGKFFGWQKNLAWIVFVFVTHNILFVVPGRTGQLIFLMMLGFLLVLWRWRIGLTLGLTIVLAAALVLPQYSSAVKLGIAKAQTDMQEYSKGNTDTSIGLRLIWLKDTQQMILAKPWTGYGTGSFKQEYSRYSGVTSGLRATSNPHNDYIWLTIELGVIGAALLLGLLGAAAWQGRHLQPAWRSSLYVMLMGMGVATFANSFFTDNITGLGFVLLTCAMLNGPKKDELSA
ncbi:MULTISPECIES: O-antigen ligase family protein [Deefgea]|uniref:O-antigen ligase-related domain-containing protein n=1 Tax=Deefgea chitinilytica TaxID=570276 RepID=A0ABS2CDG1_9NEIS|nr:MULTISPECIES: O-antigen ligase family protein [Deefgea]MBM5572171.1 hypothetical protein [Deefgea chitinilytica]MBM9889406.1 O-antigen ligase family protein [Deefgea sp. CFH1-16]